MKKLSRLTRIFSGTSKDDLVNFQTADSTSTVLLSSPESYLDGILAMPGFESMKDEIVVLRSRMEMWEQQGIAVHKRCSSMHALVVMDDQTSELHFAQLYHEFLSASHFFPGKPALSFFDARSICGSHGLENDCSIVFEEGTLVVTNLSKLCVVAQEYLSSILHKHQRIVIIVICSQIGDLEYLNVTESRFSLSFNRFQLPTGDLIQTILGLIQLRLEEDYNGKMKVDGGINGPYARVLARRVAKQLEKGDRCMKDSVQDSLEVVLARQNKRNLTQSPNKMLQVQPDYLWISQDDIMGLKPDRSNIHSSAWTELKGMVGLEDVKDSVETFLDGLLVNYYRELHGKDPIHTGLSRLFLGPPGTGKTTVAKLYGQILCDFGVLSPGGLVTKNATDFIGRYTGESETYTKRHIRNSRGKVLLIDEAYMLNPHQVHGSDPCLHRQAVVDTIMGEIQNTANDDICVILCGYKEEMEALLREANPGLARRFPLSSAFEFREFNDSQLEMVLDLKLKKQDCAITAQARIVALDALRIAKQRPNFGNGGEIDNLFSRAIERYQMRFRNMPETERDGGICFEAEDFDITYATVIRVEDQIDEIFADLVGLDGHISTFKSIARQASGIRELGRDPKVYLPFQYVFKGPSGSGKSLVARKMGRLYRTLGLLPTEDIVEVSVQDMISEYVGGTPIKTRGVLDKALGKVLVIDGTHRLASDPSKIYDYEREARDELIGSITNPYFTNKILVILVGHNNGVDKVLSLHSGLNSLFRKQMIFTGLTGQDSLVLLMTRIRAFGVALAIDSEREVIAEVLQILTKGRGWFHGHDIEGIAKDVVTQSFESFSTGSTNAPLVTGSDVLRLLDDRFPNSRQRPRRPQTSPAGNSRARSLDRILNTRKVADTLSVSSTISALPSSTAGFLRYRELPKGRFTRIICLQPADNLESPVECTLEDFCLDDRGKQYDALSYVWGTPTLSQEIRCDNKIMRVTSNCEVALRHIRDNRDPRLLWVDAICIDQQSIAEKNHQVPLMGEIYSCATQVLIWLGTGSPAIQEGLRRFQLLSCLQGDWIQRRYPTVRAIMSKKYYFPTDDTLLQPLLLAQWWKRMWTLQETILARWPVIVVGKTLTPFYEFLDRFLDLFQESGDDLVKSYRKRLLSHEPSLSVRAFGSSLLPSWVELLRAPPTMPAFGLAPDTKNLFMGLREFHRLTYPVLGVEDWKAARDYVSISTIVSNLLYTSRNRGASDPKDKIYGLHYLISKLGSDFPEVDYSENVAEIYTSFTYAFIEPSGSFWIFDHLHGGQGSVAGLPSWVPDFTSPMFRGIMGLDPTTLPGRVLSGGPELLEVRHAVTHDQGLLRCSSLFCWTITAIAPSKGPQFEPQFTDTRVLSTFALEGWLDAETEIISCLIQWLQWIERCISDHLSKSGDLSISCLQKERLRDQAELELCDTLIGSQSNDFNLSGDVWGESGFSFSTNIDMLRRTFRVLRCCMSPGLDNPCPQCGSAESQLHEATGPLHCIKFLLQVEGPMASRIISLLYANASGKYLFRTAAIGKCPGHFGLTLAQPRIGDNIAFFAGAGSPTILRKALLQDAGGIELYKVIGQVTAMGTIVKGSLYREPCSWYADKHNPTYCSGIMVQNGMREIVLW